MVCYQPLSLDGLQVLIVDSDPDSRYLLTMIFEGYGVETINATSALEAVEILKQLQPDLLISEIRLPKEDGYWLMQKVKALESAEQVQIPAIALTVHARENDRVHVEVNSHEANQPLTLRWLLRRLSDSSPVEAQEHSDSNADLGYPLHVYHKGETIPLNPQAIWQVRSGLVKLTTFSDSGQEVLVGLAGASSAFGSSLTALSLYEATALADTQLWCIPFTEFSISPQLKQRLLPQISQRLKQTESLLAIYGQTRVPDRLYSLLQLLKQEIGQPVAGGTRLSVRLTHEDLATACCTTRVSITRLLTQLQQQKKLSVDSQHHLILKG